MLSVNVATLNATSLVQDAELDSVRLVLPSVVSVPPAFEKDVVMANVLPVISNVPPVIPNVLSNEMVPPVLVIWPFDIVDAAESTRLFATVIICSLALSKVTALATVKLAPGVN